ncbi:MAG TPA: hypothetical protein H9761_05965 [Candidatus Eisenbergiella merdavium]|uniref:Uncharacterized protein n=1 Tax=Candidatus Eisenbergiella merdavium TaxID=2838551 RepID=A0A9D2SQ40_9FIRM|nr:hypothetical protein [Candidatus Eisenbergiella merdavium]
MLFRKGFHLRNLQKGTTHKQFIHVTGYLAGILKPGAPATYLYHGHLIRTAAVQAILEASPSYVQFETAGSIYTISYDLLPAEGQIAS